VSTAISLAAELAKRGVTAVPAGPSVRAWVGGVGSSYVLVRPGMEDDQPVWSWRHDDGAESHARDDIEGAAEAIAAFLQADPP